MGRAPLILALWQAASGLACASDAGDRLDAGRGLDGGAGDGAERAWTLRTDTALQRSDFSWQVAAVPAAGPPGQPFDSRWTGLRLAQEELVLARSYHGWSLAVGAGYGAVLAGEHLLTAYADDTRRVITYSTENRCDHGHQLDASAALGWTSAWYGDFASFGAQAGYSYRALHLLMTDGNQVTPPTGSYPGLHSTCDASWRGPWLGVAATFLLHPAVSLSVGVGAHLADYHEAENLNLRSDLAHPRSLEQEGDSEGWTLDVALACHPDAAWTIWIAWRGETWRTHGGTDHVHYADGTRLDARLAAADLRARTVAFGVDWGF